MSSKKNWQGSSTEGARYPGPKEANIDVATVSKEIRWTFIRNSDDLVQKKKSASVEIQRCWRGYSTRAMLFNKFHRETRTASNVSNSNDMTACNSKSPIQSPASLNGVASKIIAKHSSTLIASYHSYKEMTMSNHEIPMSFQEFCATVIQQWWKQIRIKKCLCNSKAITLTKPSSSSSSFDEKFAKNSSIKVALMRSPTGDKTLSEKEAASIIQRSWRRHIDIQVYKYYRNLINFKCKGNPSSMLRCINPRESILLDSATGAHVRFRLGGESFPPNIYYKVFTCRNIADIGAFAPRDYTKADGKQLPMKFVHNKGIHLNDYMNDENSGWYERSDNNGWRLVSDKVLRHIYQDPITYSTSNKKIQFHHSKIVRKQDLIKRQKEKKIAWLKKMYHDGSLAVKDKDDNVQSLVESVAQGMINKSETMGHSNIEDWEVDELLQWTNALNFEEYNAEWKELGTT